MAFLLAAIFLSVSVSVLLKVAPRLELDLRQAIFVNYLVAAALGAVFLQPDVATLRAADLTVAGLLLGLGIALPGMFWVLALAVRHTGVVRTDAAMRLSLLLPLVAAFTWFGEPPVPRKLFAAALGLVAIALIVQRGRATPPGPRGHHAGLLLVVFVGMGAIDIAFKLLARLGAASSDTVLEAAFVLAALVSGLAIAWLWRRGRLHPGWRHGTAGLLLGLLNFGNIVCYVAAHRNLPAQPAMVFAAMNIGVIVLAAVVGMAVFRERLRRGNLAGLVLAVLAVLLLAGG